MQGLSWFLSLQPCEFLMQPSSLPPLAAVDADLGQLVQEESGQADSDQEDQVKRSQVKLILVSRVNRSEVCQNSGLPGLKALLLFNTERLSAKGKMSAEERARKER